MIGYRGGDVTPSILSPLAFTFVMMPRGYPSGHHGATAMILADNETRVDLLNNEAIARMIVKLLRDCPDRPVTIGVHGDWGAGKSSILGMIEAGSDAEPSALCLKFNGWGFQGVEDAKIAVIEGIVAVLVEKRPFLTKAAGALKDVVKRIDLLKVAKHAGGLAFTALSGIPSPDLVHSIVGQLEGMLSDPTKYATKEGITEAISEFKSVLKPAESKGVLEEIGAFRKAFDNLLKEAKIDQLIGPSRGHLVTIRRRQWSQRSR